MHDMGVTIDQGGRHKPPLQVAPWQSGMVRRQRAARSDPCDHAIAHRDGRIGNQAITVIRPLHGGGGDPDKKVAGVHQDTLIYNMLKINM